MKSEQMLQQLLKENDESLKEKIRRTAIAAGAGEEQAKRLSADADSVRRVLSGLKPSDLEAIVRAVGEDTLGEILGKAAEKEEKKS